MASEDQGAATRVGGHRAVPGIRALNPQRGRSIAEQADASAHPTAALLAFDA